MSGVITVLCVDDSPRLTAAMAKLIDQQADMKTVGTLDRADELATKVRELGPAVVLLDLTMDGKDPLAALGEVVAAGLPTRVVVHSGHSDAEIAARALEAGAWGFVTKLDDPNKTLEAVRRVARGEGVVPDSLMP